MIKRTNLSLINTLYIKWHLLLVLILPTPLLASESVQVFTYTDYPPYLYHEAGEQTGLYLQIVELTLDAIGQSHQLSTLPFKRGMNKAIAGHGIMIGVLKNEERAMTLDFSDSFYQERVSIFFNHHQSPLIQRVDQLNDLTIGGLLGWSYGLEFDQARANNSFTVIDGELESNFKALEKGRIDALVHTDLSARYLIKQLGYEDKIFLASQPLALADIRIAVKTGTHTELIEKFNLKLKEQGHIDKLNKLIDSYR